jgi:hypothetical protein
MKIMNNYPIKTFQTSIDDTVPYSVFGKLRGKGLGVQRGELVKGLGLGN